ncbi:MAG: glycine--tRNA ligase [Candidatus Aenigmarchaeota archaeon]|nr:glycine--tRNA ligase [Candidatus Aenigmarchaeota archaeon]
MSNTAEIEKIALRRGFFFPSSEIYGGLSGLYDYGPLGTLMKRKWEGLWRRFFLGLDENFYEIEAADIMHEGVFIASGHLQSFVDPVVKCKKCGYAERADHILEDVLQEKFEGLSPQQLDEIIKKHNIKCPKCGGAFQEVGILNMMFPLNVGVDKPARAYLRPETAQGAYVNFRRAFEVLRKKLPLGLAIIGKAYRNEISPRNLLIRMREFTQAELQIFFNPKKIDEHPDFNEVKDYPLRIYSEEKKLKFTEELSSSQVCKEQNLPEFYVYYMAKIQQFYLDVLKIDPKKFRFRELSKEERAFYNKYHWDVELELSDGFREVGGIHYRTDHDLSGHQKVSKQDMSVFADAEKFVPHVLELSFGVDRNIFALMDLSLKKGKEGMIFAFPKIAAPYDAAVFPLVSKNGLPEKAREIFGILSGFTMLYDESGSIGRRYARQDEAGTPFCITVDHQTLEDNTVTVRDRDTTKQVRVGINELAEKISEMLSE